MSSIKHIKAPICIILSVMLILLAVPPVFGNISLNDVKGTVYEDSVTNLVNLGILSGFPDRTFKPFDNITRSAFAKVVTVMLGYKSLADALKGSTTFIDVKSTHWACGYINYTSRSGLMVGSGGYFKPEDPISYAEVVTVLLRALGYRSVIDAGGKWPDNYLAKSEELGLSSVVKWNSSSGKAIRGDIAKLTWKALNIMLNNSSKTILGEKYPLYGQKPIEIHFINVGQGDSIFIKTPAGKSILIDAGYHEDGPLITGYLKKQGIQKLDIIIGTHPHEDHIGGLDTVISSLGADQIYMPVVITGAPSYNEILGALNTRGMSYKTAKAVININVDNNVSLSILAPNSESYDDIDNYSAVVKIKYGNISYLFTGDAGIASENEMLQNKSDIKADVIKVGDHGSGNSTSAAFLSAVSPAYAVISVGKDNSKYGYPAVATLDRLAKSNIKVYRTDISGTVISYSNGYTITFETDPFSASYSQSEKNVVISEISLTAETVAITNKSSKNADMGGWRLVSRNGGETFTFPYGFVLKANSKVTVTSGPYAYEDGISVLKWTQNYIWNNEVDTGELYNQDGSLVSVR